MNCKAKVVRDNGILKIDINGKLYNPLSFKSFRPNPQNVSEFYKAGVRLFSVLSSGITSALGVPYSLYGESWTGENQYDFSAIDRQMDMFIENAPDAYFAPMLQVDTREWYLKTHPGVPNSFTHLSQIACDEEWKTAAAEYIKAAIKHCEEKYGDRIYGYFLLGGTTTEWFSDRDYEASHPIKEAGYRKWTGDENAKLPSSDALNRVGRVFLEPDEKEIYRARKFHSDIIADLILYFAGEAQSVIKHNKLLGLYYGYLFELGGERLFNAGSLGYEKVYLSPDIDMISSPSAYGYRGIDDSSAFMVTQKTLDAHNKLYFLEFDHITHTAPISVQKDSSDSTGNGILVQIPGAANKCKSETESLNLMYRDFLLCNANSAAMWWFDMFDGWFRSDKMMAAIEKMISVAGRLSEADTHSIAEIAVFAEGESMHRVRKSSKIATVCLSDIRRTLAECGAPYDLYSISDALLPQIKDYKLYIFVNEYDIPDRIMEHISRELAKDGKTVLWLYAPDYVKDGVQDVQRISELAGMNVEASDTSHGGMVLNGEVKHFDIAAPYFCVEDSSAQPLAFFEDGTVAAAVKDNGNNKTVYIATCNLPSELLRHIAVLADVFVYSNSNKVYVYPNSQTVGVYNATDSDAEVMLKENGSYTDLLSGEVFKCVNGVVSIPKKDINAFLLIKNQI